MGIRTDLAVEAKEIYEKENNKYMPGVSLTYRKEGEIKITRLMCKQNKGKGYEKT